MRRNNNTRTESKHKKSQIPGSDEGGNKKITEYFSPTRLIEVESEKGDDNTSHRDGNDSSILNTSDGDAAGSRHDDRDKVNGDEERIPSGAASTDPLTPHPSKVKRKGRTHLKVAGSKPTSPQIRKPTRQHKKNKQTTEVSTGEDRADKSRGRKSVDTQITDYFQPRRSKRVPQSQLRKEVYNRIEELVLSECEEGLEIVDCEGKGRGVLATRTFYTGEFVAEYAGELIDVKQAKCKEMEYSENGAGCYMYYFEHAGVRRCIDATAESGRIGRLINHSLKCANLMSKTFLAGEIPRIIFIAKRDICANEELLYDYGERNKEAIESHPWLNS